LTDSTFFFLITRRFYIQLKLSWEKAMPDNTTLHRKKDSARLVWDTKPRRAPNPRDTEFQTAEVVIPNPQEAGKLPLSFHDGLFGEEEIDK